MALVMIETKLAKAERLTALMRRAFSTSDISTAISITRRLGVVVEELKEAGFSVEEIFPNSEEYA